MGLGIFFLTEIIEIKSARKSFAKRLQKREISRLLEML